MLDRSPLRFLDGSGFAGWGIRLAIFALLPLEICDRQFCNSSVEILIAFHREYSITKKSAAKTAALFRSRPEYSGKSSERKNIRLLCAVHDRVRSHLSCDSTGATGVRRSPNRKKETTRLLVARLFVTLPVCLADDVRPVRERWQLCNCLATKPLPGTQPLHDAVSADSRNHWNENPPAHKRPSLRSTVVGQKIA